MTRTPRPEGVPAWVEVAVRVSAWAYILGFGAFAVTAYASGSTMAWAAAVCVVPLAWAMTPDVMVALWSPVAQAMIAEHKKGGAR